MRKPAPRTVRNLLFNGDPVNVHPFNILDHDCSSEGISALAAGYAFVAPASLVSEALTDRDHHPMKLENALYAVIEYAEETV